MSNPKCITKHGTGENAKVAHVDLDLVTKLLVDEKLDAEHAILCRHTVLAGGEYETNIRGKVFTVRLDD